MFSLPLQWKRGGQAILSLLMLGMASAPVSASITISEVYPQPQNAEPEWIELYNTGTEPVNLSGWTLEDHLSSPSTLYSFTTEQVLPHSFLVISLSTAKLNNQADGVTLKDSVQNVLDTMSYSSSILNQSWQLNTSHEWFIDTPTPNAQYIQPSPTPTSVATPLPSTSPELTPTPTPQSNPSPSPSPQVSSTPTPVPSASTGPDIGSFLQLNEIMACPASGLPEWLELYNTSQQEISIAGWTLADATGQIGELHGSVASKGFHMVTLSTAKLNNSGDQIKLLNPTGHTSWTVSYEPCTSGHSWAWTGSKWLLNDSPTPSADNSVPNPRFEADELDGSSGTFIKQGLSILATPDPANSSVNAKPKAQMPQRPPLYEHPLIPTEFSKNHEGASIELSPPQAKNPVVYLSVILGGGLLLISSYLEFSTYEKESSSNLA